MLVSVIIPCFNVSEYIEECIDSVVSQTYQCIEIICVDNNSSDSTEEKLIELQKKHPRIIIVSELKAGANSARNKGIELAKGEWIQFLDADDLLDKFKIEHQINLLTKNSHENIHFIAGASIKKFINRKEEVVLPIQENKYLAPFVNKCGNTCANLWNREKLLSIGNWNEVLKSSQETDLMFRIILAGGGCIADNEAFTFIRERESGQISQRNPVEKWKQYIDIRLSYLKTLEKKFPEEYRHNKGVFYDFLMVSVLILSKHSSTEALNYYRLIKNNWKSDYSYGFNAIKVFLIKFFGLSLFLKLTKR
jgi:glycosyltransferase involved in cell wall biosynthesis